MDSLLVDLDKVLDDFEAEENNDVLPPGHEVKPSGYEEYIEEHSEKPWKLISEAPYRPVDKSQYGYEKLPDKNTVNIMYDIPYEPAEKFDMSEADFAPSPTAGKRNYLDTNIYDLNKAGDGDSQFSSESGKVEVNRNLQTEYELSKSEGVNSNFVKNDLQNGCFKLPVQAADLSPDESHSVQMNGHATYSELYGPKQSNIKGLNEGLVSRPLTLSSLSTGSTTSDKSEKEVDKVPVQCNTPQTPYENVFVNPFDSQKLLTSKSFDQSQNQNIDVHGSNSVPASLNDSETDIHPELKSPIFSQSQSLSNNESVNTPFSSLPTIVSQPNPAKQFHSLPPSLGLQSQGVNQSDHTDSHESESHDQMQSDVTETFEKLTEVCHQGDVGQVGIEQVQVCSFNDDIEISEKDLVDYLGDEETDMNVETDTNIGHALDTDSFQPAAGARHLDNGLKHSEEFGNIAKVSPLVHSEELKVLESNHLPPSIQDVVPKTDKMTDNQTAMLKNDMEDKSVMPQKMDVSNTSEAKTLDPDEGICSSGDSLEYAQRPVISETSQLPGSTDVSVGNGASDFDDSTMLSGTIADSLDIDVRPKDLQGKIQRPNTLMGLSVVNLNTKSPFMVKEDMKSEDGSDNMSEADSTQIGSDVIGQLSNTGKECEGRQLMNVDQIGETKTVNNKMDDESEGHESSLDDEHVELRDPQFHTDMRPQSWAGSESDQPQILKQKRPTSLNLSPRPEFSPQGDRSPMEQSPEETGASGQNIPEGSSYSDEVLSGAVAGAEGPPIHDGPPPFDPGPPPPYSATLGRVAPKWVPDAEAPMCMNCEARFTFTKRRHHCRACGKVFCSQCCSMKNRLPHMENREGRVCFHCHQLLAQAEHWSEVSSSGRSPHPNNPNDYCSTVPPTQQAASSLSPPSVLVPVAGVLKRDGGHRRSEPKQVMFSDGIRPGGDLTELDGSAEVTRMPPRRSRVQKKVERHSQDGHHSPRSRRMRTVEDRSSTCLIPEDGLPPLVLSTEPGTGSNMMPNPQPDDFMQQIKDDEASPVIFAITPNLHVLVKIIHLDCCVNHTVWCFTTLGMVSVGQEEIVTALEVSPDEATVPRDLFTHLYTVYEEASKGIVVTELGHTIFNQSFLGSRDHGGFLYVRSTFQCVQKFILPQPPYLHAILLQKWETPWAKVFPIRLMLRLGAEYRYYPCPLIGVRNRKPVYFEIGHTIMNLLADFRNYQYMLPQISGITVHMEDKVTRINFPRNRYDDLMKVVNNSNEHVMAIGATFSMEADSHLVCIQNDDGNYQTQAINIQNKPRKVTGASFVVFNGALKTSSGMSAKSSIVEDGLMVQITPDSMLALKQAMKDMQNYTISCGSISSPNPDEIVNVQWVEDDRKVNIGVKSPIDNMPMDGIDSLHIYTSTDYVGESQIIRWTEVFFIQNEDSGSVKWDPVDLSRLGETLATACCVALTPHLTKLKEAALTKIGLRVTIKPEMVGYEAGSCGERLPDIYMNDLDSELIPVMHRATQQNHVGTVLELIFHILN